MNKKYVKATLVAIVALIGGINVFNAQKSESLSEMALANVEALATSEWDPVLGWECNQFVVDDVTSEVFFIAVRCYDCYTVSATTVSGTGHCWH